MGVKFTIDTKAFVMETKSYNKNVELKLQRELNKTAVGIAMTQRQILLTKVKRWTGTLASMIHIKQDGRWVRWIGPMGGVSYDWFIEDGSKAPKTGGSFRGHHYVEGSVEKHRFPFFKQVKNIVLTTKP